MIHFLEDFLGKNLSALPGAENLKRLFEHSKQGIDVTEPARQAITRLMKVMADASGLKRTILLLEILDILASSGSY